MKVAVESLDRVRKKVEVLLDEEQVNGLRENIYEDLKKSAKIKGFRPGKVPRSIIAAYYKDVIEEELRKKMVETTMLGALSEAKVDPVSEPHVDFLDGEKGHGYTLECEVTPEFDLPVYKGLEVEVEKLKISDEEVDNRLEGMRQMHAELINREADAVVQKGDIAMIKYEGFAEGKPLKDVKAESYPLDLGSTSLIPELEAAVIGMRSGDEKEVEVDFPADYPDREIASKRVLFKILLKEIKEKKLPGINDEFAKDLGFEDVNKLKEGVAKEIEKQKEQQRKNAITEQIIELLLKGVDFPVPARLLEKRSAAMAQDARARMTVEKLGQAEEARINEALRKEFEPQAEKRIRAGMILSKIADQETIKVGPGDVDERLKKIAEETKRAYDYIKNFYEEHDLMDSLKGNLLEENTVKFIVDHATVKEKE